MPYVVVTNLTKIWQIHQVFNSEGGSRGFNGTCSGFLMPHARDDIEGCKQSKAFTSGASHSLDPAHRVSQGTNKMIYLWWQLAAYTVQRLYCLFCSLRASGGVQCHLCRYGTPCLGVGSTGSFKPVPLSLRGSLSSCTMNHAHSSGNGVDCMT